MSSIPLPALYIRPSQPQEDPLAQATRLVQLRSLLKAQPYQQQILQQQALSAQLENQQRQVQMQQQKALTDLYSRPNVSPGGSDTGSGDAGSSGVSRKMPADEEILAAGGPIYGAQILKNMKELQKTTTDLQAAYTKHHSELLDYMGNVAAGIKQSGYDPAVADRLLEQASSLPGFGAQADQLRKQISNNSAVLPQLVARAIAMSPKQRELAAQETAANARKQQADIAARRAGMNVLGAGNDQSVPQGSQSANGQSETTGDPLNINFSKNRLNLF